MALHNSNAASQPGSPCLGSRFSRADRHEHRYQKYHRNKVTDPRQWAVTDDAEATEDCNQDTSPEQHGDPAGIGYAQQRDSSSAIIGLRSAESRVTFNLPRLAPRVRGGTQAAYLASRAGSFFYA